MTTFGEIKEFVRRRIVDLPSEVDSEVGDYVNWAIRDIEMRHDFRCMARLTRGVTQSAENPPDILLGDSFPGNWKKPRGRPYVEDGDENTANTVVYNIDWIFEEERMVDLFPGRGDPNVTGPPRAIFLQEGQDKFGQGADDIENTWDEGPTGNQSHAASPDIAIVLPRPDGKGLRSDNEYRIFLPYYGFLRDLDNDGDRNWFTDFGTLAVIEMAVAIGAEVNQDKEKATRYLALAETRIARLISLDKGLVTVSPTTLPVRTGARPQTRSHRRF